MLNSDYAPVECLLVPKTLFRDARYQNISTTAKVLYSLLLARKEYAVQNGWVDRDNKPYVIYPKSEMKKDLNCTRYRLDDAIAELEMAGNMVRIVKENGRPNRFYINDISRKEREGKPMMAMNEMMKQMKPADKEKLMDTMGEKAHEIMEELMEMGYLEKPGETENDTGAYGRDAGCPMEARGYLDGDGNVNIEMIQSDASEFGMDLFFGLAEIFQDSPGMIRKIQEHLNRVYQLRPIKEFMASVGMAAAICGNSGQLADDMRACNKEARRVYLKELVVTFNGYTKLFREGELAE